MNDILKTLDSYTIAEEGIFKKLKSLKFRNTKKEYKESKNKSPEEIIEDSKLLINESIYQLKNLEPSTLQMQSSNMFFITKYYAQNFNNIKSYDLDENDIDMMKGGYPEITCRNELSSIERNLNRIYKNKNILFFNRIANNAAFLSEAVQGKLSLNCIIDSNKYIISGCNNVLKYVFQILILDNSNINIIKVQLLLKDLIQMLIDYLSFIKTILEIYIKHIDSNYDELNTETIENLRIIKESIKDYYQFIDNIKSAVIFK